MRFEYKGKRTPQEIINTTPCCDFDIEWNSSPNKLIHGENLTVLKTLLAKYNQKIDLVYIDPPFATNNVFTIGTDRVSTISNSKADSIAYDDTKTGADFLEFIRERLVLLRELMASHASIYVHIDYKIGHYVKIIMDEVFGQDRFINDISRIKCNPKNFKRRAYGNIKDMILFYSKSEEYTWNEPNERFTDEDIKRLFKKFDNNGRRYTTIPLHAPGETKNGATGMAWRGINPPKGRHWRSSPDILEELDKNGLIEWSSNGVPRKIIYADEKDGKKRQDIWEYKDSQYPSYPTEKNLTMLKMIVNASSNPGDLVLDCFSGSGTTLLAAHELNRDWIGIDQSSEAIKVSQQRLKEAPEDLLTSSVEYQFIAQERKKHSIQPPPLHTAP